MSQPSTMRKPLVNADYEPVKASHKLKLLLQRSARYSYRQKCCNLCPNVVFEILLPTLIIMVLALARFGINKLNDEMNKSGPGSGPNNGIGEPCSQNSSLPAVTSNDIFKKCFAFPPRYEDTWFGTPRNISNRTNIVFEPVGLETDALVSLAKARLYQMNCFNVEVWNQNADADYDTNLLKNLTTDTVIIDLTPTNNIKTNLNLVYNILVRAPDDTLMNDPIDRSFLLFKHPANQIDRSNQTARSGKKEGSELPEFTDLKMFVDSLLMEYQTNRSIQYELERNLMTCSPYRNDVLFTNVAKFSSTIMSIIDVIFAIPFILLLSSLIREKNAKVKEILKVLGIEPIYNNLAQAIRTMIILVMLVLMLCIVFKIKFNPYGYFDTVNFGSLFLGYIIFSIQLVSYCIFNAQIFDSNARAIIFTIVFHLAIGQISNTIFQWPTAIQYILMFFYPYLGEWTIFQQAVLHDLANKDLAYFEAIYRNVTLFFPVLIIMIFSSIFYWALSWYLEKVFPGEFGVPQEWNFLFKRDYWRKVAPQEQLLSYNNRQSTVSTYGATLAYADAHGTPVVHVDRLVKKFGPDKIAVNEVSFDLYENQITSLLGPNGSGKTTIFNCLIGIYKQTSGTITMANEYGVTCDTRTSLENLRKSIGYCPQHDILFDLLTIEEQIEFYASARGLDQYKKQISQEMLAKVSLENHKTTFCQSLSGGMKRRLSLACAFVGNTRIILLDEPSSGLDPSNRRLLWDWLRTMKEGKTLLLTTHFMEESDALSDRILMISNGNIKADGTSAKLKEQYGSGYKLVINKQATVTTNQIQEQLRTYLPQIAVESDSTADGDVVFRTNQLPDEQFVQSLRQLDQMKANNQIKNYGVQNSTMDDVFLKIIEEEKQANETSVNIDHLNEQCRDVFDQGQFYEDINYYFSQLYALIIKTLLVRYRRWGLLLAIFLLPIAYNILSNAISESQSATGTFQMSPNLLNPQTVLYRTDPAMQDYFQSAIGSPSSSIQLEQRSDNITEINEYIRQKRIDRPYTYTDIYLAFDIANSDQGNYTVKTLSSNLIAGYEIVSVASDAVYKHALQNMQASIKTTLVYKRVGNITFEPTAGGFFTLLNMASCFVKIIPTSLILDVFVFYVIFFYVAIFLTSERKDSFLSLLNISGLHPAFYWWFNYIFDLILCVIWFCYLLAVYCIVYVAFNGSPTKKTPSSASFSTEFASAWDLRIQFYPLSILIAIPTLPFVYLITKIFRSDILCGLLTLFLLIVIHLISMIASIILSLLTSKTVQVAVYWILNIIFPTLNAQAVVTSIMARKSLFCQTTAKYIEIFDHIGDDEMYLNWILMFVHALLFLTLLIAIDCGLIRRPSGKVTNSNFDESKLDNDVLAERQRILNSDGEYTDQRVVNQDGRAEKQHTDHLVVRDLVKSYPRKQNLAVNHLTFGAKRGEAFGLLGYNGAGKTTTFRVLVGDETPTQGMAFIDGQNVSRRLRSVRRLGYCPQENCSMEYLTVRDGLYLFARIRGVHFSRIDHLVQTISSLFFLDPFLNNYVHQLSGGTKRRLHAALSLIGPPLVVILDEPTTGVDPTARQQMQEVFINAVKANLTIILTSHSMDECERVCNRLGIMFSGQFVCLGTIQHLKSKFGEGYTIEIKVHTTPDDTTGTTIQNVQGFLLSQHQYEISVRELSYSTGSFQVRQGTPADLFQLLEQNKQQLNIETYTISQTTLEQIFLSFGRQMNQD